MHRKRAEDDPQAKGEWLGHCATSGFAGWPRPARGPAPLGTTALAVSLRPRAGAEAFSSLPRGSESSLIRDLLWPSGLYFPSPESVHAPSADRERRG